jgi:hypothetical protein
MLHAPALVRAAISVALIMAVPLPLIRLYLPVPPLTVKAASPLNVARQVFGLNCCLMMWTFAPWWILKLPPGSLTRSVVFPETSMPPAVNRPLAITTYLLALGCVVIRLKCSVPDEAADPVVLALASPAPLTVAAAAASPMNAASVLPLILRAEMCVTCVPPVRVVPPVSSISESSVRFLRGRITVTPTGKLPRAWPAPRDMWPAPRAGSRVRLGIGAWRQPVRGEGGAPWLLRG